MSRMFKVEAWVLLYLFKFRIQIIKMSNVAGISKYWTTLNIFSIQNRRGNSPVWEDGAWSVMIECLCHQEQTMLLMVQIYNYFISASGKVYFAILYSKCLQNMTIEQYNVVTNVIKGHRITCCGPLLRYGCHGYHHMT